MKNGVYNKFLSHKTEQNVPPPFLSNQYVNMS